MPETEGAKEGVTGGIFQSCPTGSWQLEKKSNRRADGQMGWDGMGRDNVSTWWAPGTGTVELRDQGTGGTDSKGMKEDQKS